MYLKMITTQVSVTRVLCEKLYQVTIGVPFNSFTAVVDRSRQQGLGLAVDFCHLLGVRCILSAFVDITFAAGFYDCI